MMAGDDLELAAVLDGLPVGVVVWEAPSDDPADIRLLYANARSSSETGRDLSSMAGATLGQVFPAAVQDGGSWTATMQRCAVEQVPQEVEQPYGDATAAETAVRVRFEPAGDRRLVGTYEAVSGGRLQDRRARDAEVVSALTLAALHQAVVVLSPEGKVLRVNERAAEFAGVPASEIEGRSEADLPFTLYDEQGRELSVGERPTCRALRGERLYDLSYRMVGSDGKERWISLSAYPLSRQSGERLFGAVTVIHDTTKERLEARHDPLTDLPNRRMVDEVLRRVLTRAEHDGTQVGLLEVDLDHFKEVNDRFGHPTGDLVLRTVGERLREALRPGDIVGRYGGDEFVLVLPGVDGASGLERITERCRRAVAAPIEYAGERIDMKVSIGTAVAPEHGSTATDLFAAADRRLYEGKRAG
jgi:diguanylate cyclase (GGDEF)-like protein/PAS domain S-box-containing protein